MLAKLNNSSVWEHKYVNVILGPRDTFGITVSERNGMFAQLKVSSGL